MTTDSMEVLEQLRERLSGRKRKPAPPPWKPPILGEFRHYVKVMAFDPSLGNLAWVSFEIRTYRVCIMEKGTIRPKTERTGYEGMWDRAQQANSALAALTGRFAGSIDEWVCEPPLVGFGRRKESSEIAGTLVYMNCPDRRRFHAVPARHASSVLTGNPHHDKAQIRDAVARYIPDAATRQWNEDERDAAAAGLTYLWDVAQPATTK